MSVDGSFVWPLLALMLGTVPVCFFLGSLSPATWITRAFGKDVREAGSGNPGATNAGRVLGVKWGVLVGVLDVLKGYLPCWFLQQSMGMSHAVLGGVSVVLGHVFSPFLRGRGGKGVATTLGVILAVAPWLALGALGVFALAWVVLRRMGEASMVAAVFLLVAGILVMTGWATFGERPFSVGLGVVALALLVLARHRDNMTRAWQRLH